MGNGLYLLANASVATDGLGLRDVFQLMQVAGLSWLAWRQKRMDRLESRVEKKAEQLVKARIDAIGGGLKTSIEALHRAITEINKRLERGDERFHEMDQGDRRTELQHVRELHDLSDFVRDKCASKEDMQALSHRFDGLQQAVAKAVIERVESEKGRVRT